MTRSTFELVESTPVDAFGVTYEQYAHRRTGARHIHLRCNDPHNAFMVSFATLPTDSTGVAHILEHTTLCGSERYPVRDPFFMMLRRSLNTYMNAFTSGDSTAYPFATQNPKDFENLLSVYLDAVFFPRLHPLDFAQEGWRLEPDDDDPAQPLKLHGVVYNEMKGAMSSPLSQLWQHVHAGLFPDAVYHHNSGGEPLAIPELSHQALQAFHRQHYHPSNATLMTYGDITAKAHQARFEELALARFDEPQARLMSTPQASFKAPREVAVTYAVDRAAERQTHAVWAWVIGDTVDVDRYLEAHLLSSILLEHSASPLRHFLETSELANAPSELCGIDDSSCHLVFVCGVEGSEDQHAEQLQHGIMARFQQIAENGVAVATLEAIVDRLELAQRDLGGGSYPFGLQLMSRMLPAALYQGSPLRQLDLGPAISRLRERLSAPKFVENLVQQLLIDNPHRVRLVMSADDSKSQRDQAEEQHRLVSLKHTLGDAGIAELRAQAEKLRQRQAEVDDDSVLPKVTLADVPDSAPMPAPVAMGSEQLPIDHYECGTNGVFRVKLAYRLPQLSAKELEVLPLWCEFLTEFGQGQESYLEVQSRRALSGHYSIYALTRPALDDPSATHAWIIAGGMGLARKREQIVATAMQLIPATRFDENQRLAELLAQSRAESEQSITERGHQLAILAAARNLSAEAALDELWDGPSAIKMINMLEQNVATEGQLGELFARFRSIQSKLASAPKRIALIGEAEALKGAEQLCVDQCEPIAGAFERFKLSQPHGNIAHGWLTNSQVNFCASAYAAAPVGSPDAPALAVLGRYLQDGFLHREIREQGGAYGSGASYDSDSATFRFFSYRDPRSIETFEDFDKSLAWYTDQRDPQRLEESILGAIRALDQPRAPAGEAERAFVASLCGRDDKFRNEFRRRVLAVDIDQLVNVGQRYLHPARQQRAIVAGADRQQQLSDAGFTLDRL